MNIHECREHKSSDKLTKISNIIYDPHAHNDRWDKFISEIMSGYKGKERFLQKLFGYGLTGNTRHECMTILYGAVLVMAKGLSVKVY